MPQRERGRPSPAEYFAPFTCLHVGFTLSFIAWSKVKFPRQPPFSVIPPFVFIPSFAFLISILPKTLAMAMAAGFASLTVLLCLLCFSTLSTAVDLPARDHTNHDSLPESHTNSDVANTIFLPSERSESESATVIQSQPEIADSKISKPDSEVETFESTESSEASDSTPITVISFRPLNRHMPWRPMPFPSRPGHRCRHNHKFKPWNPRLPRHEIPYGNDMILSNGKEKIFDVLPDDQVRRIPIRWTRFGGVEPRFADEPGMERSEVMRRPHHHDHDHDHDHDHEHDEEHDHHHHHRHHDGRFHERDHEDGGLMMSIRKFLQHF